MKRIPNFYLQPRCWRDHLILLCRYAASCLSVAPAAAGKGPDGVLRLLHCCVTVVYTPQTAASSHSSSSKKKHFVSKLEKTKKKKLKKKTRSY